LSKIIIDFRGYFQNEKRRVDSIIYIYIIMKFIMKFPNLIHPRRQSSIA